ncbi:MAG: glycosyltransferase family 39 protein [Candidatus Omnitrophota bacterium]
MKNRDLLIIVVFSAVVLLWSLGGGSLCSWDEGMYGGVAREIVKTNQWIDLRWGGLPWSDKPPLYMWMTALFYMAFGVGEFSVRFFSALCGVGTVVVTYLLARRLYSRKAAFCSALVLLSTWHFIWSAKMGMLDVPLTFFTILSIYLFKTGEEDKKRLFFAPLAFALAFLTKGAGALIIPIILFLYMLFSGNLKTLKQPPLAWGISLAFAVLVWWHWTAFAHYGEGFVKDYFVKHLLTRTTQAVEGHSGDILTYFGVIPNKGRPWAGIGFVLLPYMLWRILKRGEKEHLIPVVWAGTILVIFSLVKTKLHWYVMPIYPPLAIMTGWAFGKLIGKHTVPVMCVIAAGAVGYLAVERDIFNLDYSPAIKQIAHDVVSNVPEGSRLYLYDISDPGMQFYLGEKGENIRKNKLPEALQPGKGFMILNKRALSDLSEYRYSTVYEESDFILIKP